MVVKFALMQNINSIFKLTPNLQKLNEGKQTYERYYIDRHLPKCLQDQKKGLRDEFYKLKNAGKKPSYKYDLETASMYIKVKDDKKDDSLL